MRYRAPSWAIAQRTTRPSTRRMASNTVATHPPSAYSAPGIPCLAAGRTRGGGRGFRPVWKDARGIRLGQDDRGRCRQHILLEARPPRGKVALQKSGRRVAAAEGLVPDHITDESQVR